MKLNILEITVVLLIGLVTYFYFTIGRNFESNELLSIGLATIFGMNFGLYFSYRKNRAKLKKVNFENFDKGVANWLYYLLGISLTSLCLLIGYKLGYCESIKPIIIQLLLMLIVIGNYNSIIDPKWINPDIAIKKSLYQDKMNRFAGKQLFALSMLGILMTCILPQNYSLYIFFSVIIISSVSSFIFSKKIAVFKEI